MIALRTGACAVVLAFASPAVPQGAKPSFDCAKAKSGVEKAICASPRLAALDVEVSKAYSAAIKRLGPKSAKALRDDQRSFGATLDFGLDWSDGKPKDQRFDLAGALTERAAFLAAIVPAGQGPWAGEWRNNTGAIEIKQPRPDRAMISVNTAQPVTGNWVCNLEGPSEMDPERLTVFGEEDGKRDGFAYHIERRDEHVELIQQAPKDASSNAPPICGHNGSMEGSYFLTRKTAR